MQTCCRRLSTDSPVASCLGASVAGPEPSCRSASSAESQSLTSDATALNPQPDSQSQTLSPLLVRTRSQGRRRHEAQGTRHKAQGTGRVLREGHGSTHLDVDAVMAAVAGPGQGPDGQPGRGGEVGALGAVVAVVEARVVRPRVVDHKLPRVLHQLDHRDVVQAQQLRGDQDLLCKQAAVRRSLRTTLLEQAGEPAFTSLCLGQNGSGCPTLRAVAPLLPIPQELGVSANTVWQGGAGQC